MKYRVCLRGVVCGGFLLVINLAVWIAPAHAAAADAFVLFRDGAPKFTSADGRFQFKPKARFYFDYASIEDDAGFENTSDSEFRSGRIGFEGFLFRDFEYKFELDFTGGEADLKGVTLAYVGFKPWKITVGLVKQTNSLEEMGSSRYTTFMERGGFTDAFALTRRWGATIAANGDNWGVEVNVVGADPNATTTVEGYLVSSRVHYAPNLADGLTVHLGASFFHRENAAGDNTIRYRQRPHAHLARNRFVDTGVLAADSDTFYAVEAAALFGAFSLQGEYSWIRANRVDDGGGFVGDDPTFEGGYISLSWFLGGGRNYLPGKGIFGRPKIPAPVGGGGWGALELGARIDLVDLEDKDIRGGEQIIVILGVNWHLTSHARLMFNYSHADIDGGVLGAADGDNQVDAVMLRAQFDW